MKNVLFLFVLLVAGLFTSCSPDNAGFSSGLNNPDSEIRTDALTLQVTFANRSTATYTAGEIVGEEDVDGLRVILDPGTLGEQTLTAVTEIEIRGSNMKVIKNPGANQVVYTGKTALSAQDASSGFNVTLNPGNISFNAAAVQVIEE
ncbi:MAG: hypothetical protein IPH94_03195 [Saprospiraceae bacterium]|nr:hypothetical protein [Saprospiraceae bacterium]